MDEDDNSGLKGLTVTARRPSYVCKRLILTYKVDPRTKSNIGIQMEREELRHL